MSTITYNRRAGKTGRPLGMVDVLSKVFETAALGMTHWAQARRDARLALVRSASAREAAHDVAAVRRLANTHRHSAPGFASDLYAAADQHELKHLG